MASNDSTRRGSSPIIRINGATIVYRMWITVEKGRRQMLVLRCDDCGEVLASISDDGEGCKLHTSPQPF